MLKGDLDSLLTGWVDRTVSIARIRALLGRGAALGLALEKWQRAGLWVLTRSDHEYPERLKRRLRSESPAVLFGCGNKALLNTGGIAVVGSRDADDEDLAYTGRLGAEAAAQGYSLVSGGARGVDQSAMLGALESQGTAVGVLADSLLRSATSAKYRKHIMSGDLALISTFNPEAGFNVGHAMSRNRYIYCLADAAVVISSTRDKGGTWNGAIEDIRAGWVPLWVKPSSDRNSGNRELAQRGANWFPEDMTSLSKLFEETHSAPLQNLGNELPLIAQDNDREAESDKERKTETSTLGKSSPLSEPLVDASVTSGVSVPENSVLVDVDFYTLFLARIVEFASTAPMTVDDVAARLELEKVQVNAWLKRADNEGKVTKLTKPVRYIINPTAPRQAALFER